jgi:hypothetical protein
MDHACDSVLPKGAEENKEGAQNWNTLKNNWEESSSWKRIRVLLEKKDKILCHEIGAGD